MGQVIRMVYESCNSETAPTASHYLGHLESGWVLSDYDNRKSDMRLISNIC